MITATVISDGEESLPCTGCLGSKGAPLAGRVTIGSTLMVLCQECGRDLANAVGFLCIREGGWSRLEPRKRVKKGGGR